MAAPEDYGSLADLKRRVKEVPENLLVWGLCFQLLAYSALGPQGSYSDADPGGMAVSRTVI